jgi:hypothetical protein
MINIFVGIGFFVLIFIIISISYKYGKEKEHIKELKNEISKLAEEQRYANEQVDNIRNMSDSDVRNRLHKLANMQSKRMQ